MEASIKNDFGNGGFTWAVLIASDLEGDSLTRPHSEYLAILSFETTHYQAEFGW